jgi:hypothetical protein
MDWVLWMFELEVNLAEDKKVDCDPAPEGIRARRRDSRRKKKEERRKTRGSKEWCFGALRLRW